MTRKSVESHRRIESDTLCTTVIVEPSEDYRGLEAIASGRGNNGEIDVLRVDAEVVATRVCPGHGECLLYPRRNERRGSETLEQETWHREFKEEALHRQESSWCLTTTWRRNEQLPHKTAWE